MFNSMAASKPVTATATKSSNKVNPLLLNLKVIGMLQSIDEIVFSIYFHPSFCARRESTAYVREPI